MEVIRRKPWFTTYSNKFLQAATISTLITYSFQLINGVPPPGGLRGNRHMPYEFRRTGTLYSISNPANNYWTQNHPLNATGCDLKLRLRVLKPYEKSFGPISVRFFQFLTLLMPKITIWGILIDQGDQLLASNAGLRQVRRGGWQALEHWLFQTVLTNIVQYCTWSQG
ncbi:hypothetical protein CJF32_00011264 [Rutstroemia sp. NJR-2017a WRK4]|nr:hypothetical protein CJF32_00011264 [Rutstroemia sp. NJR-2017a WRK4]